MLVSRWVGACLFSFPPSLLRKGLIYTPLRAQLVLPGSVLSPFPSDGLEVSRWEVAMDGMSFLYRYIVPTLQLKAVPRIGTNAPLHSPASAEATGPLLESVHVAQRVRYDDGTVAQYNVTAQLQCRCSL